ncbi:hypothetical protein Glove_397g16 [Diversispora epigaea]|uniref:Chitinase II/V-like catalytic domain-containing protein n=1 Tax=Diversispora epigaea TaxID=1348612 RepID=A0A397H504_9GLOM|nr:hypothetical protein Glove_397g16 [Diversispora epigaea]
MSEVTVETTENSSVYMGKNEIFASFSYKVDNEEYIKRDTGDNNACSSLYFSDVLSNTKVFGFYDPLKPLENGSSVVEFIKDIRIDYLNYIVNINRLDKNEQELGYLRSNFSSPGLQILLSITSSDLEMIDFNKENPIREITEKYKFDGVNIVKNDCDANSLNKTLESIKSMHSVSWNKSLITTFTMNANDNDISLNNISSIQDYVNYTIIQAFYLNPNDNKSAPLNSNNNNTVTFNSLFKQLKGTDFKKLIWGFDLSGIMKNPKSITGLIVNDDMCLINSEFSIWPWKEIRNTALVAICTANSGWRRYFNPDTSSTILLNPQPNGSFAYEDPESLYHKFNWVTSNNFAGISIANLAFDSIDNNNSILKFIKLTTPKNNDDDGNDGNGSVKIPSNPINDNNGKNNKVIIGVVVGCILFAIGLFMIFFYCSRRRKRHSAIEL